MGLAAEEWRKNWRLVLASSLGFSFFSVMMSATGLFMEPLSQAFGWSRTLLSSGPSIASAGSAGAEGMGVCLGAAETPLCDLASPD